MCYKTMKTDDIFSHIKNYWLVYAFLVQLIVNYTIVNTTLQDHAKRIDILEDSKIKTELILSEINSRLASIETSLKFLERQLK